MTVERDILTELKLGATAFFAALTAWLGTLAIPVYILVGLNIVDYWTGIAAAPYRGEKRSSAKGYHGIVKKICIWVLVWMGAAVDGLLAYTANTVGIALPFHFLVASAVAIWLICNEFVSILENMGDIGVELPDFLMTLVKWIQSCTEQKVTTGEKVLNNGTETNTADR
ncbi:MAG: phage holin family protein [Angelakisella sp.]